MSKANLGVTLGDDDFITAAAIIGMFRLVEKA